VHSVSKVQASISISLDGFIAGPSESEGRPFGVGGMQLHEWKFSLKTFRGSHGEEGGGVNAITYRTRVVVLTRHRREPLEMEGGTTFHYVTEGIELALEQARAAAGEKNVSVGGGANALQQYLAAGLLDEMLMSLAPVFLGGGARLFDNLGEPKPRLRQVQAVEAPGVTHVRYTRVDRSEDARVGER
jgi:dihydrofolate reductase